MGQSSYSLAYGYYTKRFDRNIVSYCSPQVYNILKYNINSPFLEFYKKIVEKLLTIRISNIHAY